MFGIFIAPDDDDLSKAISALNKLTTDWTMRAARGECSWICSDCGTSFPDGMPDACGHDMQRCTDIITRDKADARKQGGAK